MAEYHNLISSYVKPLIRVNSCLMVPPCCLALSLALKLTINKRRNNVEVLLTCQAAQVRLLASV